MDLKTFLVATLIAFLEGGLAMPSPKRDDANVSEKLICNRPVEKRNKTTVDVEILTKEPNVPFFCPSKDDLSGCLCDPDERTLDCSFVLNLKTISEMFQITYFPFKRFQLFKYDIDEDFLGPIDEVFPSYMFGDVTFHKIQISNTNLRNVDIFAFSGSEETLESIEIVGNCHLQTFPFYQLRNFVNLRKLKIIHSSLQSVPALGMIPKLEQIDFSVNVISSIHEGAFKKLPALKVLDLGFNKLQQLHCDDLAFCLPDVLVYLYDNFISDIKECTFNYEHSPDIVDLTYNRLTSFPREVFEPLLEHMDTIGYVSLDENPIDCDELLWLGDRQELWFHVVSPCKNPGAARPPVSASTKERHN